MEKKKIESSQKSKPTKFYGVGNLTLYWYTWMKNLEISMDKSESLYKRGQFAKINEHLIKRQYETIEEMDEFFENRKHRTTDKDSV